jgi:hypothetical protein
MKTKKIPTPKKAGEKTWQLFIYLFIYFYHHYYYYYYYLIFRWIQFFMLTNKLLHLYSHYPIVGSIMLIPSLLPGSILFIQSPSFFSLFFSFILILNLLIKSTIQICEATYSCILNFKLHFVFLNMCVDPLYDLLMYLIKTIHIQNRNLPCTIRVNNL